MGAITKKVFLKAISCPTLGWLTNSDGIQKTLSIADKFRIEQGLEIQQKARNIFPDGRLVTGDNVFAAKHTQELLKDEGVSVIFEATFLVDGYIAKADILIRRSSGWHILEVKSGVNDKKEYLDDLAYTAMVVGNAGLEISDCSLMLLSRDYRLGMEDDRLFIEINHTKEVLLQAKEFTEHCDIVTQIISQDSKPDVELKWECKGCDIFKECVGQGIKNHIFDLPRLSQKKFSELIDLDVLKIEEIPSGFKLTPNQIKVNDSVKTGQPVIDKEGMSKTLESILFPTYNLDFETVQTAIPLYLKLLHHYHKIRQWLKTVFLVSTKPYVKGRIIRHLGNGIPDPLFTPINILVQLAFFKCYQIVWRVMYGKLCGRSLVESLNMFFVRSVEASYSVPAFWIDPDITEFEAAVC